MALDTVTPNSYKMDDCRGDDTPIVRRFSLDCGEIWQLRNHSQESKGRRYSLPQRISPLCLPADDYTDDEYIPSPSSDSSSPLFSCSSRSDSVTLWSPSADSVESGDIYALDSQSSTESDLEMLHQLKWDPDVSPGLCSSKLVPRESVCQATKVVAGLSKDEHDRAIDSRASYSLIDTVDSLGDLLGRIWMLPSTPPSLFVGLEGRKLGRDGAISFCTIHVRPLDITYVIDVTTLGPAAFRTCNEGQLSLGTLLETDDIPKVFFDCRSPSDALYNLFGIKLGGVEDIQLLELARRKGPKKYLKGLSKCVEQDAGMAPADLKTWIELKHVAMKATNPAHGGNDVLLDERPAAEFVVSHCARNARCLSFLWSAYAGSQSDRRYSKIKELTRQRILATQAERYQGQGKHMVVAPPL